MTDTAPNTTLADFMRESTSRPFLQMGPPAPKAGWVYRDFRAMPRDLWLSLLDLLGDDNIEVVAANQRQLPPADFCRAQIWISPAAQVAWTGYLSAQS